MIAGRVTRINEDEDTKSRRLVRKEIQNAEYALFNAYQAWCRASDQLDAAEAEWDRVNSLYTESEEGK